MKKTSIQIILMMICLSLFALLVGCKANRNTNNSSEALLMDYYTKETFKSIIVGESTYRDVYVIAPTELMLVTSYGGLCEYPMKNGGYVRIKYYSEDLVVGSIEEVSESLINRDRKTE